MASRYRVEKDSMGSLRVPSSAAWGVQTQRAIENFPVSGLPMPTRFIRALALIKASAAQVNAALGGLDPRIAAAIIAAANEVAEGQHSAQFPVDVFQTGSGTSSNMNANEVLAHLASKASGMSIHPNDHVNCSQSSNDVVPTAIHLSAALALKHDLLPALKHLAGTIERKGRSLRRHCKTGRTHLMDAMPLRFDQELSGWAAQIRTAIDRLESVRPRLHQLAQGGTAVGTGVNAPAGFSRKFATDLSRRTGLRLSPATNAFEALSSQDTAAELSGQLKVLACALMKIANDLRWMNSGPLAGLGEIELPALQPGSSIMPGKVNPVIPESVAMVAAQVIGNDATIAIAAQSGNFQLNVMLPVIAHNLLQSLQLLTNASILLADKAIAGFRVRAENLARPLSLNPILVTALNPVIGYEQGAAIAKQAYAENRPVLDVAAERTSLGKAELRSMLNPEKLTRSPR
ncbi:class II fumarate hydratase [Sinimarinibacterium sp. CAU 1509]|uniref:class II fumarate hydratase n=1 Tax=Sinimarinibacterium sp. CAU 1509 TaxID=2562283 RepID=UPI0010AC9C96|nr:class II fumarate hydratase [Sinimarinibacterium sp. CAU 1509]TJY62309.1 class II fumarate hydratase [Sinimarinibacterium sp. CAU 1509]